MTDLTGQPGVVRMTIEIKRAATGETEQYELIGTLQPTQPTEEKTNGSHTLDSGA